MSADHIKEWFAAHDAAHKASDAYNTRLALVRAERERGNWSMDVQAEYAAVLEAEHAAVRASEALYAFLHAESASLKD